LLPVNVTTEGGKAEVNLSSGGLVSAISAVMLNIQTEWWQWYNWEILGWGQDVARSGGGENKCSEQWIWIPPGIYESVWSHYNGLSNSNLAALPLFLLCRI